MYTQCPHCDAIFQLTTAQLKAANGDVRCGQCLAVFNALNHLSDDIPTTAATPPKNPTDDNERDDLWADDNLAASNTKSTVTKPTTDKIESTVTDDDDSLLEISPETAPKDSESEIAIDVTSGTAVEESTVEESMVEEALLDTPADAKTDTTHSKTASDATDADIFSEIIAEASQHALPTEAIDRFEAFLSNNAPTFHTADNDVDNDVDMDSDVDDDSAGLANEFDTLSVASDETSHADLDVHEIGEVEAVTAELDAELHIDTTDEFAEFDEYLQAADEVMGKKTNEPTDSFRADSVELDAPAIDAADSETVVTAEADSDTRYDLDGENEAIIIEEADLEPITSKIYTDKPGAYPEGDNDAITADADADENAGSPVDSAAQQAPELDDFSDLAEAAAEVDMGAESVSGELLAAEPSTPKSDIESTDDKTWQPGNEGIRNIPALILEDLHAAKAEQLRPSNAPWVIGSLLLMLTLVLQVVYFSRDELAKDISLRPWLIQMCQFANCTLTQPYDIKQIEIIGREVRSHPSARKALIASTTLINNADFVQPFPLLTVVFSDINGKPLAQRRFTPREYLSNTVDLAAGMTPNLPVRIELELVDPGKAAVNYEFHSELDPRNTRPLM